MSAQVKMTSLGGQWMDHNLWLIESGSPTANFPPKPEVLQVLQRHAPLPAVRDHHGCSLLVSLHIETDPAARAAIVRDLEKQLKAAA